MISSDRMQLIISKILLFGTLLSTFIVMIGGIMYLTQHGFDPMQSELLKSDANHLTAKQIWLHAFSFTSLGIVALGLLALVTTQILRVGMLMFFYLINRDYAFTLFAGFILIVLIYSCFLRQ